MKIGNIVKLTDKALKTFYSTDKNASMYFIGEDLKSEDFVKYVDDILSFEDGNFGGIVVSIICDTVKIKVKSRLTGQYIFMYKELENLKVVME